MDPCPPLGLPPHPHSEAIYSIHRHYHPFMINDQSPLIILILVIANGTNMMIIAIICFIFTIIIVIITCCMIILISICWVLTKVQMLHTWIELSSWS